MTIILILLFVLLILVLYSIFYKDHSIKKVVNLIKASLEKKYKTIAINKISKNTYEINAENNKYLFFIYFIPLNTTVQINSSTTWELKIANSSSAGASHTKTRYLNNISNFMNIKTEAKKIIIFTPSPKKVVMYINECEIINVDAKTNVYGTNIIRIDDISKLK